MHVRFTISIMLAIVSASLRRISRLGVLRSDEAFL